jgi:hypothetical protein
MLGFNGGLIGQRRVTTPSAARGLWTLNEQVMAKRQQLWPSLGVEYRYWRWVGFTTNNALLEVSEWRLMNGVSVVTGGTWTYVSASIVSSNGPRMTDGVLGTGAGARAFQLTTPVATTAIIYDHGSVVQADGWQYAQFFGSGARFVTAVTVEGSNDGTTYFPIASFSGLTQYTSSDFQLSPVYLFSS